MRKIEQENILELLQTLYEANTELKQLASRGESQSIIQLLADCQAFALSIGTYIEEREGKGTKTVSLLEAYCKLLYEASQEAAAPAGDGKNIVRPLRKQLIEIENSIREELKPDKIEVAFFPYSASMWDSLESIWLAAREDPQCDAYVVPVPYYDKQPDGTLGSMHYEGGLYPDYVPVTDWQEYDVEARRPDIIFIHSPYDNGNHITSIHPDFYSGRLKEYTDLLVYVPYFVVGDDVPARFCTYVGVLNADLVVVQSEKVRDTYARVFREFEQKKRCKGMFGKVDEKFLALGSPKFDKVASSSPEDFSLPQEWERLIAKPDGRRKKVILYNTSIDTLLKGNEQYLEKVQSVLSTFQAREDTVLWWRPHPFSDATYRSMRARLLEGYEAIVEEYKAAGWGIYDDTPDLHRAIFLTDAYYGDPSSLIPLYMATGKPAIEQNYKLAGEAAPSNERFAFENLYSGEDCYWFASFHYNALFKMDKESWDVEYMGSFPGLAFRQERLFTAVTENNGHLFFAPGYGNDIGVYSIETGEFSTIPIRGGEGGPSCYSSVAYAQYVFFAGGNLPAIIRYDTISGAVDYYSEWVDEFEALNVKNKNVWYFRHCRKFGDLLYLPSNRDNYVLVFNMKTCISSLHRVGTMQKRGYSDICHDGTAFWLVPNGCDKAAVRWDGGNNYEEFRDFPQDFTFSDTTDCGFTSMAYADGFVYMFPYSGNQVLKVDVKTGEILVAEELADSDSAAREQAAMDGAGYIFGEMLDGEIIALSVLECMAKSFDPSTGKRREGYIHRVKNEEAWRKQLLKDSIKQSATPYFAIEASGVTLPAFLELLNKTDAAAGKAPSQSDCGRRIYTYVKEYLGRPV